MTALEAGRGGLFFCCSVATPAGKEDTIFPRQKCLGSTQHSDMWAENHPVLLRATADVSGAPSKRRSELDYVGSWRSRHEPQLWEETTLQSHFQGNTQCEYDFLSLPTDFKKVTGEKKNVYGTQRICSCSTKTATQFLSPHIGFMTISAVSIY